MNNEQRERVASGLRRMNRKPDALIYIGSDLDIEESEFSFIPIFYSQAMTTVWIDVCFVPIFNEQFSDSLVETKRFCDGFMEYQE